MTNRFNLGDESRDVQRIVQTAVEKRKLPRTKGVDLLITALVAAEDRRFWLHPGVDPIAVGVAIWGALRTGRMRGASTIEQQLVRTIRRRYEPTLNRKFTEIAIAMSLRQKFQKRELAIAYLECAYFGWKGNGVLQMIARLGYSLDALTPEQAAYLIALINLPLPEHLSDERRKRIERRANHIAGKLK